MQRFGGSLNLNVHLHVVVVDGIFSRDEQSRLTFTAAPPPSRAEMLAVVRAVRARLAKLAGAADPPAPLAACARIALSRGQVRAVTAALEDEGDSPLAPERHGGAIDEEGFNLTYCDIARGPRSPSAASSHCQTTKSDIASKSCATAARSSAS